MKNDNENTQAGSDCQDRLVAHLRFAVYPGEVQSQRDGDIHHIGFARLCELYNVPSALCVDMSRHGNRVGRDLSKLVALRPSYRGNYTLTASERGACPLDTDGDGDCHKCFNRPCGCPAVRCTDC